MNPDQQPFHLYYLYTVCWLPPASVTCDANTTSSLTPQWHSRKYAGVVLSYLWAGISTGQSASHTTLSPTSLASISFKCLSVTLRPRGSTKYKSNRLISPSSRLGSQPKMKHQSSQIFRGKIWGEMSRSHWCLRSVSCRYGRGLALPLFWGSFAPFSSKFKLMCSGHS